MADHTITQYFGPSPRHGRACVEIRFAADDNRYRLASLEPMLLEMGFKLRGFLPDEALPLDEAVCRLAALLLARHRPWWNRHGRDGETGWAAIEFPFPQIAASMLRAAHGLLTAGGPPPSSQAKALRELAKWMATINKSKMWLLAAAREFGLETASPIITCEVYQLGQGTKGVHFYGTASERDGFTAAVLEGNKHSTAQVLRRFGLPATRPVLVGRPQHAAKAIARVGLPCVVKPLHLNKGAGVATGLANAAEAAAAIEHAIALGQGQAVLVENQVEGDDYRLMVGSGDMLWAYRKTPTTVTGDGAATVAELIERENSRRRTVRFGSEAYLYEIVCDDALDRLLADRHGLARDSVLAAGRSIEVVGQGNVSRGAYIVDVTGIVHPDNRALAVRVARLFRQTMMGIDFITPDITRSWKEVPCAIIEVNRAPGISGWGDAMFVYRTLFSRRLSGRIPTVVVIGSDAYRAETGRSVVEAFERQGLRLHTADYSGSADEPITLMSLVRPVEQAMLDPEADAVLVLCQPERVERQGVPVRRCDLLLIEQPARFGWLEGSTPAGSPAEIAAAVDALVPRYADPDEGGPLPVLEPIEAGEQDFKLAVWRTRAMPRAWFWNHVGTEAPSDTGLTTHDDLLAAVRALAVASGGQLPEGFAYDELPGSWTRVTFEATIALPAAQAQRTRAALLAATERVNQIAALAIR